MCFIKYSSLKTQNNKQDFTNYIKCTYLYIFTYYHGRLRFQSIPYKYKFESFTNEFNKKSTNVNIKNMKYKFCFIDFKINLAFMKIIQSYKVSC